MLVNFTLVLYATNDQQKNQLIQTSAGLCFSKASRTFEKKVDGCTHSHPTSLRM